MLNSPSATGVAIVVLGVIGVGIAVWALFFSDHAKKQREKPKKEFTCNDYGFNPYFVMNPFCIF